jgi:hypothetical protein
MQLVHIGIEGIIDNQFGEWPILVTREAGGGYTVRHIKPCGPAAS